MKDSFVFYTEYRNAIEHMTNEQAGLFLKMLLAYMDGDGVEAWRDDDPVVWMFFMTIKPRLDRDLVKWEETVEKRKEAGRKGGQASASKRKQSQANVSKSKQTQANQAVSDCVTDCVYVSPKGDNNARARTRESQTDMFDRLITGRAVTHDMQDKLREWIVYKQERNEPYKETGMKSLITQAVNNGAAYGGKAVTDAIDYSMASGYKGIVWDRVGKSPPKSNKFLNENRRNYDYDDLERALLASN